MNALVDFFPGLLAASARGAVIMLAVLALRRVIGSKVPNALWPLAWIAASLPLFAVIAIPTTWSPFNWWRASSSALSVTALVSEVSPNTVTTASTTSASLDAAPAAPQSFAPINVAATLWLLGVVVLAATRATSAIFFSRKLRRSQEVPDARLGRLVREWTERLGVDGKVDVIVTPLVSAPAIYGGFKSILLFPPRLANELTDTEIRVIILHELGHHCRRDRWLHALFGAAEILHWFNPIVWFCVRLARGDCELACDEFVLRRLTEDEPTLYGSTLLKVSVLSRCQRMPFPALGILEGKRQIKRRIKMITGYHPSTRAGIIMGGALLMLITAVALTREARAQADVDHAQPSITTTAPAGWFANGSNLSAYVVGVDPTQKHDGAASAYVKSIKPVVKGFGGMMQMCAADSYVGKRLRLSAWLKAANANDGGAHLWFRVDGQQHGEMLGFDNMDPRPVMGSTDWAHYSLVLDVPQGARALAYGFFVQGTGLAWVSDFKIEEVGNDVPTTNLPIAEKPARALPKAPVNLSFN